MIDHDRLICFDNFNRADGALNGQAAPKGGTWSSNGASILGKLLAGINSISILSHVGVTQKTIYADTIHTGNNYIGIVCSYQDDSNYWFVTPQFGRFYRIYKVVAGSSTSVVGVSVGTNRFRRYIKNLRVDAETNQIIFHTDASIVQYAPESGEELDHYQAGLENSGFFIHGSSVAKKITVVNTG